MRIRAVVSITMNVPEGMDPDTFAQEYVNGLNEGDYGADVAVLEDTYDEPDGSADAAQGSNADATERGGAVVDLPICSKREGSDMITVYAQGKIQANVPAGTRAGEYGPAGSDFVVKNGDQAVKFVDQNYRLQPGDTLFVTQRGVAG